VAVVLTPESGRFEEGEAKIHLSGEDATRIEPDFLRRERTTPAVADHVQ
jgi:hypothetical protein